MECIYLADLSETDSDIVIPSDQAKHLKVLRLNTGDKISASNGKGLLFELVLNRTGKTDYTAKIASFDVRKGECDRNITVALGVLDDKNRMEFAVEKITELGAVSFIPLITEFSQKHRINIDRLQSKAISAMKQSKRSVLTTIKPAVSFSELLKTATSYDTVLLADEFGDKPNISSLPNNILIIVGPEGGLSENEIKLCDEHNFTKWSLGSRRLRAETALITMTSLVSVC
jgi:16S rRNA (uracil1498-N3)-methyltransferase